MRPLNFPDSAEIGRLVTFFDENCRSSTSIDTKRSIIRWAPTFADPINTCVICVAANVSLSFAMVSWRLANGRLFHLLWPATPRAPGVGHPAGPAWPSDGAQIFPR